MEWTRRSMMIALAMLDGGSSKGRWETYQRLLTSSWTEEEFCLADVCQFLTAEEVNWLSDTDFCSLEKQYRDAGIKFLMIEDALYPERLRECYLPPVVLFFKGDIQLLKGKILGIVGSRQHTYYSEEALTLLLPTLIKEKVSIASGLAKGVDSLAHRLTLSSHGKTIAVVGTGLNICYPRYNEELAQTIAKKGLLLSEYPMESQPLKFHFPYRNRIIAGISHGVLVTEAKLKSGSLITANVALSENRAVFALPGYITSSYSQGTNELLSAGAIPVCNTQTIIEELAPIW